MISILARVGPNLASGAAEARLVRPDSDGDCRNGFTTTAATGDGDSRNGLTIAAPAAHAVLKKELGI
ncbi:hypothetical protein FJW06_10315 [Mesorhizobium sp. B4-1-3]|uniref:hypothetical protein n=1 Tax=Mesorhizobium sp. B4-1-3 TaxID=2589889 RepID=UPI001127606D|nr:hypothetical protein [Mesorhizobium sp. B4-1-3]TPI14362.1 hypothetical protein FJW06_10315 [Mesorhizobium sp. B4-1-3]